MQTANTETKTLKTDNEKYATALKAIASIPDALFKSDAKVMRTIARTALK